MISSLNSGKDFQLKILQILKMAADMRKVALLSIKFYQYAISPLMASHCRFYPSCSCYTYEAIEQYGLLHGSYLGVRRLLRCHPWNPGGYDPVPPKNTSKHSIED